MDPGMHLYIDRFRAQELREEAARRRLARGHEPPPAWSAGAHALGWLLVELGLRLVRVPGPAGHHPYP
ncbi:hypothetical protein [Nonomuraea cavernae]|uniref:Uncharacterized protein n=1 Tax=Nonomuraea cavernae TaxID=2045107 RepID=A0A918DF76_9ACTN|nr:hypothetical protein [Nonomuraea cavernae]MCA2184548.1 hypothetical protein [Nonomuraea cavernae]GGO63457.1 hypothetical protein GCM10012289_10560 [Nonomuraea cavernae]